MAVKFYVCEMQTVVDGAGVVTPYAFDDRNEAEAKYHDLLAVAAVSNVDKHGAMLFNEDGFMLKSEVYNHYVPPVPPEPDPEPNTET